MSPMFSGRTGRQYPIRLGRGDQTGTDPSPLNLPFPICPVPPAPASRHGPHLCSSMPGAAVDGLSLLPPEVLLLARGIPYQERPISPLAQAGEGQALGDTSRDSSLILAKLLQSPTAHTQTRLFQRLIKLKQPWSDPYGNGNAPVFSTKPIFPHWISSPCFKVWKH